MSNFLIISLIIIGINSPLLIQIFIELIIYKRLSHNFKFYLLDFIPNFIGGIFIFFIANYFLVLLNITKSDNEVFFENLISIFLTQFILILIPFLSSSKIFKLISFKKSNIEDFFNSVKIKNEIKKLSKNNDIIIIEDKYPNAYTTCLFKNNQIIILTSSLFQILSEKEILSLIYHEIGHIEGKHFKFRFLFTCLSILVFSIIYSYFLLKIDQTHKYFIYFHVGIITFFLLISSYFIGLLNKKFEFNADNYSKQNLNYKYLISSLEKLTIHSGGKMNTYDFNYPSIQNRINKLRENEN